VKPIYVHDFQFPVSEEPIWRNRVDRWYQLDAAAFGLCEVYSRSEAEPKSGDRPDLMILASPGSSNLADWNYARVSPASPSKFVHTLPNVRASGLLQLMGWSGPVLCLQNDPHTIARAIREARFLLVESRQRIEIFGCAVIGDRPDWHSAFRIKMDRKNSDFFNQTTAFEMTDLDVIEHLKKETNYES
jgi:hypothetical protein